MAKRKRLTVPNPTPGPAPAEAPNMDIPLTHEMEVGKTPDRALRQAGLMRAPIADVAGEAAATHALTQVAGALTAAKQEGRMIEALPLDVIDVSHLIRDRMVLDEEDMEALKTSLRARGQQAPIEVTELGRGRYGLISGYRRLQALKDLRREDPETATGTVLALIRHPEEASDAYIAMVEENEIRAGLSYYERASIVQAAVREGVFPTDTAALQGLFGSASRSKRSKIKSFLPVIADFGSSLMFPTALTERTGLALAARAAADAGFAERLRNRLRKANPDSAEAEQAIIAKALAGDDHAQDGVDGVQGDGPGVAPPAPSSDGSFAKSAPWSAAPRADVAMVLKGGQLTLTGAGVTPDLAQTIADMLRRA